MYCQLDAPPAHLWTFCTVSQSAGSPRCVKCEKLLNSLLCTTTIQTCAIDVVVITHRRPTSRPVIRRSCRLCRWILHVVFCSGRDTSHSVRFGASIRQAGDYNPTHVLDPKPVVWLGQDSRCVLRNSSLELAGFGKREINKRHKADIVITKMVHI